MRREDRGHDYTPFLREIIRLLRILTNQGVIAMATGQEILDALEAETDAGTAVVMLLDTVVAELRDVKASMDPADQAKMDEALAKINANKETWAAAALRNTHSG